MLTKSLIISPTLNSKLLLNNRINNGLPVFNGGLGENPLPTPEYLIKTLKKNINKKDYTNIQGKDIFIDKLKSYYPNYMTNTIVGNGLKELIFTLIFSWKSKILIPVPCWVTYLEDVEKLQKDYYTIETFHKNNYKLTPDNLEKCIIDNNATNSLLFINNPNNPTGAVYSEDELISIVNVCKKYNVTIFGDEIYFNTRQTNTISISKLYDNCIIGSSLSKDWASGGWRFGWMIFSENLNYLYNEMISIGSILYSCPTDFMNDIAAEALSNEIKEYYFNKQNVFFKIIADKVNNQLKNNNKIITSNYQGAWYKWFDLKNYSNELKLKNINNSQELTNSLASNIGLIVVPGKCFGVEGLTFRLSMVDPNIYKGIEELIKWLESGTEHSCTCS